ncbi:6-deoxyerythronolide-B synthase [Planomonospora sphaerica]|uniref:6-deoxyerythronolide-B synthase n=1 Tax=Planomonospora sphaerica TaxID=161355 RepID=A0A161LPA4_9ACTN|nr:6-deoxyerythronolide-B synthase [Planomonospora sphaerica]
MFRLLESWGVRPDVLVGHSVGELAAAHVAGVLSLEDVVRLVVARGRLMQALPAGGVMVAVQASEAEVAPLLTDGVGVAAVNGPSSVVVSGEQAGVEAVVAGLPGGRRWSRLRVSHAFHSPLMEPVLEGFRRVAESVTYRQPDVSGPVAVSTVTGRPVAMAPVEVSGAASERSGASAVEPVAGGWGSAEYWVEHVRRSVRFADAVAVGRGLGVSRWVEVGPDAVLTALAAQALAADSADGVGASAGAGSADGTGGASGTAAAGGADSAVVGLQRRGRGEVETLLTGLGRAYAHGVTVDWARYFSGSGARRVELPTYAFQRKPYWADSTPPRSDDPMSGFWDAMEQEDLSALAARLDVDASALGEVVPALTAWRRCHREHAVVDSWRYRVTWRPIAERRSRALDGTWLVVVPEAFGGAGLLPIVLGALAQCGAKVVTVKAARADRAELGGRLASAASGEDVAGVLSLLALDDRPHPAHPQLSYGCAGTVTLVQSLEDAGITAPLWCVTSGAVAVDREGEPAGREAASVSPGQTAVWGLGAGLALDLPGTWGGLVDLPARPDERVALRLCDALSAADGEDQLAIREDGCFARRMVRAPAGGRPAVSWRPEGTVLITGGTGGVGAHVARMLAGNGAEHLLLTSRRGMKAPGAAELVEELTARGTRITIEACDVADRDELAALLRTVPEEFPLTGVVHAAGTAQRIAPPSDLTIDEFAQVGKAKILGAVHLDELLADRDLSAFVLFSSGAAVWGSAGQAAYAGANAFLDGLAHRRRARGLRATSIAWGSWDAGMVDEELGALMKRIGAPAMPAAAAAGVLGQPAVHDESHLVVADFDWPRFTPAYTLARPRPLLNDLPDVREVLDGSGSGGTADATSPVARLASLPEAEQSRELLDLVRTHVAALLGYDDPAEVDAGRAFDDLGFDSVAAVDLRTRLNAATRKNLPSTMVFDHTTPTALAEYLRSELCGGVQARPVLTRLDQLEETAADLLPEEIESTRIIGRLQALITKLNENLAGDSGADVSSRLEAATADDIFTFIDTELGLA